MEPPRHHPGRDHPRSRGVYPTAPPVMSPLSGSSPLARGLRSSRADPSASPGDHPRSRGVYHRLERGLPGCEGSSPLARGLLRRQVVQCPAQGIIPARAGFTRADRTCRDQAGDHPRSRGVYWLKRNGGPDAAGSSPLARGLPPAQDHPRRRRGIIPARAGFTSPDGGRANIWADHPRSRGVYRRSACPCACPRGSSPLARGLPDTCGRTTARSSDHPRSRGVYASARVGLVGSSGSSPLARGLQEADEGGDARPGIIPARAGFTRRLDRGRQGRRDHPRSRGVYALAEAGAYTGNGSSPLARGLPGPDPGDRPDPGIIPARAGFTRRLDRGRQGRRDHPRSRGVYVAMARTVPVGAGSSPLARGLLEEGGDRGLDVGIIPARAGFTVLCEAAEEGGRDHPRSRGVYWVGSHYRMGVTGSSPLARGLPDPRGDPPERHRIIPARAGFTLFQILFRGRRWDHPRSRGVYRAAGPAGRGAHGSSPLARGLQATADAVCEAAGIIPARAGFTRSRPPGGDHGQDHPRSRGVY